MGFVAVETRHLNQKEMKWFKKNWIYLVLIALIGYFLTDSVVKSKASKREIGLRSDSIAVLKHSYQELEKHYQLSGELVSAYKFADSLSRDSLQDLRFEYFNQKQRHVKKIADLKRIPTDSLYRNLTGQLDSLSLQW